MSNQADWRLRSSTGVLVWLALAAIIVAQALPFTYGYRRSADEIDFLVASFGGWRTVEEFAKSLAAGQGRLGFFAVMPLNVLGAYLADSYLARWVFVLLHFGMLALFAGYFSILSATNVVRPLFVVLVALQSIGGVHDYMPPVSYPLQNTLPILALLIARCTILLVQPHGRGAPYMLWPARIVFLLAVMTTEYAFLLGTALLAAEYGGALARIWRRGASPREALVSVFTRRPFLYDAAIVAFTLATYLAYRQFHPSVYAGNVIDAGFDVGRVVETTIRHTLAGTIFSSEFLKSLPYEALPMAIVIGVLTAACLFAVLYDVRDLPLPLATALGSALAVAYVTFPLAANAQKQMWCVDHGACGWLDSRISYLGVGVIIVCMIAVVLRYMPNYRTTTAMVAVVSGSMGLIATTTYTRNLHDGLAMAADAKAWERAALLACYPAVQPAADLPLLRLIDPERLVRFHPGTDTARFWRDYMTFLRTSRSCPDDAASHLSVLRQMNELGPTLSIGQTVRLTDKSANRYLGVGWSQQEPWGVWSVAEQANLVFLPRYPPGIDGLQLRAVFRPYIRPSIGQQTISVSVNGHFVDEWTISQGMFDKGCCERTIALGREPTLADEVDVTFHIHDPRSPEADREIVDDRRLGIFLHSMTLTGPANRER